MCQEMAVFTLREAARKPTAYRQNTTHLYTSHNAVLGSAIQTPRNEMLKESHKYGFGN
jgi:hypothetical protein